MLPTRQDCSIDIVETRNLNRYSGGKEVMNSDMTAAAVTRRAAAPGEGLCVCAFSESAAHGWTKRCGKRFSLVPRKGWGVCVAVGLFCLWLPPASAALNAPSYPALLNSDGISAFSQDDGGVLVRADADVQSQPPFVPLPEDSRGSSSGSSSSAHRKVAAGVSVKRPSGIASVGGGTSAAETSAASQGGPTGADLPERPSDRHYICRYSKANGGVCGWRGSSTLPTGLYCPANNCCSKTACRNGLCNGFCDPAWALCSTGLIYYDEYSYGKCNCSRLAHRCPSNSTCHDDAEEMGGAYCLCEEGFYLKGESCVQSPCKLTDCSPGTCVLAADESPQCECPSGYASMSSGGIPYCKMSDPCKETPNPCGANGEALSCTATSPDHYTCTCASGYSLTYVDAKATCASKWALTKCTELPCGSEGVDECRDSEAGPVCVCKSGYKLQDAEFGKQCVFDNPCDNNVCGPPSIVLSCTANTAGYSCQCQTGYSVTITEQAQYCEQDDNWETYKNYIYIAAAAAAAIILALLFCAFAKNQRGTSDTLNSPVYSEQQPMMMGGNFGAPQQQYGVQPSPSQWG